jgi:hypothetical protein
MTIDQITADATVRQTDILRRYMDLPKLLDLLYTKSLYFRRADGFADKLEGALFPAFRKSLDEAHALGISSYNSDHYYQRARLGNYVSCWTIGASDNMALWQLYGGVKASVALTTTVDRLIGCGIDWHRPMSIKKVQYIDHRRQRNWGIGPFDDVLGFKNKAYKFERELRVVLPQQHDGWETNPMGIRLPVPKLDALVRSVVISPEADPSFLGAVTELCKSFGLSAPVRRSTLSLIPV